MSSRLTLKEEMDAFVSPDPVRAVRLLGCQELIRAVGSLLGTGASEQDVREVFELAVRMSSTVLASMQPTELENSVKPRIIM